MRWFILIMVGGRSRTSRKRSRYSWGDGMYVLKTMYNSAPLMKTLLAAGPSVSVKILKNLAVMQKKVLQCEALLITAGLLQRSLRPDH